MFFNMFNRPCVYFKTAAAVRWILLVLHWSTPELLSCVCLCVCLCERCGSLLMSKSLIGLMTALNLSLLIHKLCRFLSLERSLLETEGLKGGNLSPWLCVFLCRQQHWVLNGTLLVITHLLSLISYLFCWIIFALHCMTSDVMCRHF